MYKINKSFSESIIRKLRMKVVVLKMMFKFLVKSMGSNSLKVFRQIMNVGQLRNNKC